MKKILVIDDEPDLLEIVATWLKDRYEVLTATGGAEGLRLAEDHGPDLILLDIMMPGMNGLEVLSALKGSRKTATIPVLMLTAKKESHNILEAETEWAEDFLAKPFKAKELLALVRRCIG